MVDGILIALDRGGWEDHYNIGADVEITIGDLAYAVADAMDVRLGGLEPSEAPAGGTNRRCPDISKLRALGYEPKVSLSEGLARMIWLDRAA